MVNYLPITCDEDHGWLSPEDYQAYINAPDDQKSHLLYQRLVKSAAWFLGLHKKSLVAAYDGASDAHSKEKYRWLMQYHNECVPDHEAIFAGTRIDIDREITPRT